MKTVLFATDFSVDSLVLSNKAKSIAQALNAQLHIVHVTEPPIAYPHMFANLASVLDIYQKHNKMILEAFCHHLDIPLEQGHLLTGSTMYHIEKSCKDLHASMLIVGSHGAGGYWHLLGSNAQKLIQTAPCSVLILNTKSITEQQKNEALIYYARKAPLAGSYMQQGLAHGKPLATLKELLPSKEQSPNLYGSKHGVGQEIKHGHKPSFRMPGTPYGPIKDEEGSDESSIEDGPNPQDKKGE